MLLNESIESCLDTSYPVFTDDAEVVQAITLLQDKGLDCAPVLLEGNGTAMISLADLLPAKGDGGESKKLLRDLKLQPVATIGRHEHLFEVFSPARSFTGTVIPVSEMDGRYAGVIAKVALLEKIAGVFHLNTEGMTLEMEIPAYELKLSEVVATLEKNDATVLSFGVYPAASDAESRIISFRIHTLDLYRLVKNLEKYGYLIRYTSPFFKEKDDELREKALEFIHFMDM